MRRAPTAGMLTVAVLAMLAACGTDDATTEVAADYSLEKVRAIAGAHHVVGLDVDHTGGVWLAYHMASDVYTFDDLRIVHLDHEGATLAEFRYTEADTPVSGIAVTGDALWVSHGHGRDGTTRVRKLDATTGAELLAFPVPNGTVDLTARDNLLILSNLWREIVAIDATTGAEVWRAPVPELADSECRGIAATDGGTWIVSLTEARAVLVDDSGATIERAAFPFEVDDWSIDDGLQLAVDGTKLVLNRRNQITWYAPAR